MPKFMIMETCEYEIEADSMEEAKVKWLDDPWGYAQAGFLDVIERVIAPMTAARTAKVEETDEF